MVIHSIIIGEYEVGSKDSNTIETKSLELNVKREPSGSITPPLKPKARENVVIDLI